MKKIKQSPVKGRTRGSTLAVMMIIMFVMIAVLTPFFSVGLIEMAISQNQSYRVQAFYIADAGIAYGNYMLATKDGAYTGTGSNPFYLAYSGKTIGSFKVTVTQLPDKNFYRVVSVGTPTGTYSGASILAITKKASTSDYNIFRETMSVNFGDGYHAYGKVHVNSNLLTSGRPIFDGKVTCTGVNIRSGSGTPDFRGGFYSHSSVIKFPDYSDITTTLYDYCTDSGFSDQQYTGSTIYSGATVTFDGSTARITLFRPSKSTTINYAMTTATVLGFRMPVYVSGSINGQATIIAWDDIEIVNNLGYKDTSISSDDLIGLISLTDVVIDHSCPDNTVIRCAMALPNGCFKIHPSFNASKRSLNFYGSMATYTNGSFTNGTKGFTNRNFYFDPRLSILAPPKFKYLDNEYSMIYWKNAYFL